MNVALSPRTALVLFIIMLAFLIAQAVWWITFMAILVDEKVELAEQFGASQEVLNRIHREEISRQVMIGMEGLVFLIVLLLGLWLIYRSYRRLGELKRHQENFLMAVTHELKTPLSSLRLYLDTLESEKISDEQKEAVIPRMRQDAFRLQKLIERALEAGRFGRDKYKLRIEKLNLSRLIDSTVDSWKATPRNVTLSISSHVEPDLVSMGDRAALKRVLDIIFENALKYNQASGISIDVTAVKRKSRVVIEITDNGVGLERSELKMVFDRFYRVGDELTRNSEGSGLGLYLCRELIKAQGGTISAESAGKGTGSTFRILLPGVK